MPKRKFNSPAEKQRDWVARNPKRHLDSKLRFQYGITSDEKEAMVRRQNGLCFVCDKPFAGTRDTCVDHNHETGIVRSILCRRCNIAIGYFEAHKDKWEMIKEYIA